MPISGTTTNYTGRAKDLFISQGINPTSSAITPVAYSFGQVSACIAGVQKLIQRYVISLINAGLLTQLMAAQGNNIQEATHIFNFINWGVVSAMLSYQNANPSSFLDEQISTATLTDPSVNKGSINLTVQLTTQGGGAIVFVLPVTLT